MSTRQRSTYWLSKESGVSLRIWLTVRAGGSKRWTIWCETLIRMIGFAAPLLVEEILIGDCAREARVVLDEFGDELVQSALENLGHARPLEPRVHCPRLPLSGPATSVVAGERVERAVDALVAGDERARHRLLQDQEVGDQPRLHPVAIDPVIGGGGRDRAQDGDPLEIVERTADRFRRGQEQMIFDVEQPRRIVRPLDEDAEAVEPVAFVAQHRAVARTVEIERGLLHVIEKAHQLLAAKRAIDAPARLEPFQLKPGIVDRRPGLGGQRGAHGASRGARVLQAIADRGGVGEVEGQEFNRGVFVKLAVLFHEPHIGAGGVKRALPFADLLAVGLRQIFEPERRLDGSGDIVGPLHGAGEAEEIVGSARKHGGHAGPSSPSTIQVSLVPPPWLELTTSDPSFSATRVRPPGTMRTPSAPERTNGRRSTWRGATPPSNEAGQVDKASVGWAM